MPSEAIPLVLVLLGLISAMSALPPGEKPAIPTVHLPQAEISPVAKTALNDTSSPRGRLQRFHQSCNIPDVQLGGDCLAYNQMVIAMKKRNIWNNESELLFSQELSRTLTPSDDDLCSNITIMVKNLPSELAHETLKTFRNTRQCVGACYASGTLNDGCRVLYVGYKALQQFTANSVNKVGDQQQQPQPDTVVVNDQQANLPKQPKAKTSDVSASGGNAKPEGDKIIPHGSSNGTKTDAKPRDAAAGVDERSGNPFAPIADSPKNAGDAVGIETKKQENVEQPQPALLKPEVGPEPAPEKSVNEDDTDQDEVDEAGDTIDAEPKDAKGATQVGTDYEPGSEETNLGEVGNDNADRAKESEFPSGVNEPVPEKVRPQVEDTGMPRTSDIVQGEDPFYNQNDSNFFSYFLFAMFSCVILYVAYHNKSKLMALVVEGRRTSSGRGGFSKGRKHTAAYRKLDSNLEEAITSASASGGHASSQIIY